MNFMKILAEKRTTTGTSASKKARAAGKLPAVIYGSSVESLPVLVDLKEFEDTIRAVGANGVFSLDIDGEVYKVFVKDTASYALTPKLYHIDLQAFTAGEKVTMTIPVYVVGEENIKEGTYSDADALCKDHRQDLDAVDSAAKADGQTAACAGDQAAEHCAKEQVRSRERGGRGNING